MLLIHKAGLATPGLYKFNCSEHELRFR